MSDTNSDSGDFFKAHVRALADALETAGRDLGPAVEAYSDRVHSTLVAGGTVLYAGNGGSASLVEHIAAEYTVRFRRERAPLPALALTGSTAALTAAANDFGFDAVFVRAVRALGHPGDLLVLHSTSGNSPNLIEAARTAREMGIATVAVLGAGGGQLAGLVDLVVCAPGSDTATIQEVQLAIEHAVADRLDARFADGGAE